MFNNPLNSFHDTVAEAKEEREQLDRLLTVSTPRERLLVALAALLLVVLAAWLFFGDVARSLAVEGVLTEAGEASPGGNRSVQALVWVGRDAALHVKAGMPVAVELAAADEDPGVIEGEIAEFSALPFSGGLAALESSAPMSVFRIDIALDESFDLESLASGHCRIVIELGRQSLVSFLRIGQS